MLSRFHASGWLQKPSSATLLSDSHPGSDRSNSPQQVHQAVFHPATFTVGKVGRGSVSFIGSPRPAVSSHRRGWLGKGELLWIILETLRKAPAPLTAREIALPLMERRSFDQNETATVRLIGKQVDATVRRREGLIERVVYGPRVVGWMISAM